MTPSKFRIEQTSANIYALLYGNNTIPLYTGTKSWVEECRDSIIDNRPLYEITEYQNGDKGPYALFIIDDPRPMFWGSKQDCIKEKKAAIAQDEINLEKYR